MPLDQVQQVRFRDFSVRIWRDDLYELVAGEKAFCGNKARKLYHYLHADYPDVQTLVSYGSAQSNMLYSLAVLARIKGWKFEFFVDHIPKNLAENPRGNYALALQQGAKIQTTGAGNTQAWAENHVREKTGILYVPEGGRSAESEPGIALLVEDINRWVGSQGLVNPRLMLPSGTGTMAFYLQKHLPFEVLTCACVGDADYLRQQFSELESGAGRLPVVLPSTRKYHFGKLYPEFYQIWQQLKAETGIEFDLLYDPSGWLCMLTYQAQNPDTDLIYLHQGGQLGNSTMLQRYGRSLKLKY